MERAMSGCRNRGFIASPLLLYGLLALALVAALAGLYAFVDNRGYQRGKLTVQAAWEKANKERRDKEAKQVNTASTGLEKDNAKARIITRTITTEVDRVVEKPIYRNVCLDDAGLCLARAAIRGESADSCKPDKPMRPVATADRWDGRIRLALDYRDFGAIP